MTKKAEVMRACAGCRKPAPAAELVRFAAIGDPPGLVPDIGNRLGGRGVSLHPKVACFKKAQRHKALERSAKLGQPVDVYQLAKTASVQYERRISGLILAARRSSQAVFGATLVKKALADGEVSLVVVAKDASSRSQELLQRFDLQNKVARDPSDREVSLVMFGTKHELGLLFGKAEVGVLAIKDSKIAAEVARAAARAAELAEVE